MRRWTLFFRLEISPVDISPVNSRIRIRRSSPMRSSPALTSPRRRLEAGRCTRLYAEGSRSPSEERYRPPLAGQQVRGEGIPAVGAFHMFARDHPRCVHAGQFEGPRYLVHGSGPNIQHADKSANHNLQRDYRLNIWSKAARADSTPFMPPFVSPLGSSISATLRAEAAGSESVWLIEPAACSAEGRGA